MRKKSLKKENYRERLIDDKISKYLTIFGAVSIEGPKWCGKTWTSLNHANSVTYMTERSPRDLAKVDPKYIFTKERPQLIDEWQLVPSIWDAVRHECDSDHEKGKFILTGSTILSKQESEEEVFHSGIGRIATMKMYPMSLYESGDSTGDVSIRQMLEKKVKCGYVRKVELDELAKLIIRGGWPENIDRDDNDLDLSVSKLLNDHHTFGLMFEALVERELRIYMDYLDGHLYHFRDNVTGDEVDAIVEFRDGSYGAIEIKLSDGSVDEAKKSLMKFYNNVSIKLKFMCVIVGHYEVVIQDKDTGIYVILITSLRP